jgi:16S rRNA (guanine527-N7)-methyltransferase
MPGRVSVENIQVPSRDVAGRITRRAGKAGVKVPAELGARLEVYLDVLGRWNKKINLTALPLEPLSDEAVDRLVVEPLVAASRVRPTDRLALDIGSGGGSPALPLRLACPALRMVLVEVKVRKSAFLREVVRQLGLTNVEVVTARYEEVLTRPDLYGSVDLVSVRAVRADSRLWTAARGLLAREGRVFWFTSEAARRAPINWSFNTIHTDSFGRSGDSCLVVAQVVP